MLDIKAIENAKHILLKTNSNTFANASALYTYLLTLHKKVSLFSEVPIEAKLSFAPWYEKMKSTEVMSADLVIEARSDTLEYLFFFQENEININKKMATALYGGLLLQYENFSSSSLSGIVLATASQLISLGAEYKKAQESIAKSDSLALFRLKARLYTQMTLKESATAVELCVCDEDFAATGAVLEDAFRIMREFLSLVHVRKVTLKKKDDAMRILKIVEEIEVEK